MRKNMDARQNDDSVPLLRRSSAGPQPFLRHCLFQAVAHRGEIGLLAKGISLAMFFALVLSIGCGRSDLRRRVVYGAVTCGGEKVAFGEVLFVPIEGTRGPATAAVIVNGQYRAENRGGVPIGKHRVEVSAQRSTGRKVATPEGAMVEEGASIGPASYAGPQSPLVVEVKADGDGRIDLAIPR
jgi:hypothetical protein